MHVRGARSRRRGPVLAFILLACAGAASRAAADTPARLKPGARPIERSVGGGDAHRYTLKLKAGQYCAIRVRQSGIDLVAIVDGPDGTRIAEVDTPRRTTGDEIVELVAAASGAHTITIRAREDDAGKAGYAVSVERPRAAADADRATVAALRVFERAEVLRREGTAESLPRARKDYEDALERFAATDHQRRARALLRVADVLTAQGYSTQTNDRYRAAAETFGRAGDRAGEAEALSGMDNAPRDAVALAHESGNTEIEALALARRSTSRYWRHEIPAAKRDGDAAMTIFRHVNNRWGLAVTGRTLAKCVADDEPNAALAMYTEALRLAERVGDLDVQGGILGNRAYTKQALGDLDEAIEDFTRGIDLGHRAGSLLTEGWELKSVAQVYIQTGQLQPGLQALQRALALLRTIGMRWDEAVALETLGSVYGQLGNLSKAIDFSKQALAMFQALGDRQEEAVQRLNLGDQYESLGRTDDAHEYYTSALRILQEAGNRRREGWTYGLLGAFYTSRGEYRAALEMHQKALDASRAVTDPFSEIRALARLADVYRILGEPGRALELYEQALAITRAKKFGGDEAQLLVRVGYALEESGDLERARQRFSEGLALIRDNHLKLPRAEAAAIGGIGATQRSAGDIQGALTSYRDALDVARRGFERGQEIATLNGLGETQGSAGNWGEALTTLAEALRLARESHLPGPEGVALRNLMTGSRASGRPQLAVFYGKQAVNLFQTVRANIAQLEPQTQRAYIRSKESVYRELADLLVSLGRLPEAQHVLDLLKEHEYRDYVRRAGDTAPRDVELTDDEAAWQERYRVIQDRVVALGRERSDLATLRKRTPEQETALAKLDADMQVAAQAFQSFLASLAADFDVPNARERAYNLREAQTLMADLKALGSGAVALYTIVGEERYRVILITPDVEKAAEYPIGAADLRRKIQAFRQALQNPETDPRPLAQDLYTILIGPIARDLDQAGARTLMWALDDALRYVPFAALHDGRAYLVEKYRSVVFTPASRGNLRNPSAPWLAGLGVGVSKGQEGFQPLPAVADELRGIIRDDRDRQATGVLRGHLLLDEAFTEPALRAELRTRPPVVHVASHFQFRPGNEADSFLLLGDGRHLSVADLKSEWNLFDGVDLLTLSACDTATGTGGSSGKEVESFGVLAQRNGARTVIATLWPVADRSTRQLMEYFYRARTADNAISKGEALRRAQLALLRGGSPDSRQPSRGLTRRDPTLSAQATTPALAYSHPYYWAPFLLIGNWR